MFGKFSPAGRLRLAIAKLLRAHPKFDGAAQFVEGSTDAAVAQLAALTAEISKTVKESEEKVAEPSKATDVPGRYRSIPIEAFVNDGVKALEALGYDSVAVSSGFWHFFSRRRGVESVRVVADTPDIDEIFKRALESAIALVIPRASWAVDWPVYGQLNCRCVPSKIVIDPKGPGPSESGPIEHMWVSGADLAFFKGFEVSGRRITHARNVSNLFGLLGWEFFVSDKHSDPERIFVPLCEGGFRQAAKRVMLKLEGWSWKRSGSAWHFTRRGAIKSNYIGESSESQAVDYVFSRRNKHDHTLSSKMGRYAERELSKLIPTCTHTCEHCEEKAAEERMKAQGFFVKTDNHLDTFTIINHADDEMSFVVQNDRPEAKHLWTFVEKGVIARRAFLADKKAMTDLGFKYVRCEQHDDNSNRKWVFSKDGVELKIDRSENVRSWTALARYWEESQKSKRAAEYAYEVASGHNKLFKYHFRNTALVYRGPVNADLGLAGGIRLHHTACGNPGSIELIVKPGNTDDLTTPEGRRAWAKSIVAILGNWHYDVLFPHNHRLTRAVVNTFNGIAGEYRFEDILTDEPTTVSAKSIGEAIDKFNAIKGNK